MNLVTLHRVVKGAVPVIYVIDVEETSRRTLERMLQPSGFQVHAFDSIAGFLAAYANSRGCLIIDIDPLTLDGLTVVREIQERNINLPIIVVGGNADVPTVVATMKAGAMDFVSKPFSEAKLIQLARQAVEINLSKCERRHGPPREGPRTCLLTPREREVLRHVVSGKTNREIAQCLNIGIRTVESHRAEVMHKLNMKSLVELLRGITCREVVNS